MVNLNHLYIDPGTGSMLFSILIGVVATGYFLFRALIIKVKVFFSGGHATTGIARPYIIYCEGSQYQNVFKPILEEFETRQIAVSYLTSAAGDPALSAGYRFVTSEFIGEDNKAFARLNLAQADVVLMTTPGLHVYQLKRSKLASHYSHILHAPSDATMYRLFGLDYFDSVLLSGDYQGKDIRTLEAMRNIAPKQLVSVGCTYLDVYAEKIKQIPKEENHPFTVLVSPSWGAQALLARFGEKLLDPLAETGFRIIVRPHPQSKKSEKALLERLQSRYKNNANVEWDCENENIFSLAKADIMISDFSGIIFDYAFLCDKPVLYVKQGIDLRPYDADDICETEDGSRDLNRLWQFRAAGEIGIELKEESFPAIADVMRNASDSEALRQARQKARDEAWQHRGEAGKRVVDFLVSVKTDLDKKAQAKNDHKH
jgi:hypothetical protein